MSLLNPVPVQKAEDAAHSSGDKGTMALAVRRDTASSMAGTDNDYLPLTTDSAGRAWVNVGASTIIGAVNETAPGTDTASSGLNGRLQRIAQRLTSLIALLPASLGQKTMANSMAVALASDQSAIPVTQIDDPDKIHRVAISVNSATPVQLVAAEPSARHRVLGLVLTAASTVTVAFSEANEAPFGYLTGIMTLSAGVPMVWPLTGVDTAWIISSTTNKALYLAPGSAVQISGAMVYAVD